MEPTLAFVLVLFCLLSEGFFSGSEFVLISINRAKLRHLAETGRGSAASLETLLKKPERVFGATSVGTNLSVFAGTAVATVFMADRVSHDADFFTFLVMGPLTLILGEIVPKIMFRHKAETLAVYIGKPLGASLRVFAPVLVVTSFIARLVVKIFLRRSEAPVAVTTREEIFMLTKMSEERLDLNVDEKKMIHRIFEFRTSTVDYALRPLVNIVAVPTVTTLAEAKARIAETGYSRLPVFHERIYNIIGIISVFDIMRCANLNARVDTVMKPAMYTPITKRNAVLLREMQENNVHMAVVVDEYGGATGIVTMEDLLEEIFGEIQDEYDHPVKFYDNLGNGRYIIDAMVEIDALNDELGFDLPTGDYETLSGLINDSLERIPRKGSRLAIGPYLFTVLEATERRTKSVELLDLREKPQNGDAMETTGDNKAG